MWLMSGIMLTMGVGIAIVLVFAVIGFAFFYKRKQGDVV